MVDCPVNNNKNKKINLILFCMTVVKSNKCSQNEHGLCEGIIPEIIEGSSTTEFCNCSCHNNMYQLIRRTLAVVNQGNTNLDYGFPASDALN